MALNDILQKISTEADKKATFMKQVVNNEISKIQEEAKIKAAVRKSEIEEKIQLQSISIIKKSKTLAKMVGRSQTLKEKREVIDKAYEEVEKELEALDGNEYLKLITAMMKYVKKSFSKGNLIVPSHRKKLTEEAIDKADVEFHIKDETTKFKGGFIVMSGKIEINLSFPYLIQNIVRPDTELEVAKILFS